MRRQEIEGQKRKAIELLNQFMQDEGFLAKSNFVPFSLDNFVPQCSNTLAERGDGLLAKAAERGRLDLAHILIDQLKTDPGLDRTPYNASPLYMASRRGHVEIVKLLLAKGVDVKPSSRGGTTPLDAASIEGYAKIVELLLASGAEINPGIPGIEKTPLYLASQLGHVAVVKLLIRGGADANRADRGGATPLMMAAEEGHEEVVELLICGGAHINQTRIFDDVTPLHLASQLGHVAIVESLLVSQADINSVTSSSKETPLMMAAEKGHEEVVELLICGGAHINQTRSFDYATPLHLASQLGHVAIVKLLLGGGAAINKAIGGKTPLLMAAEEGHISVVELLLGGGADVNAGMPLYAALERGRVEAAAFLIFRGGNLGRRALPAADLQNHKAIALADSLVTRRDESLFTTLSLAEKRFPSSYSSLLRGISEKMSGLGNIEKDLPGYLANLTEKLKSALSYNGSLSGSPAVFDNGSLFTRFLAQELSDALIAAIASPEEVQLSKDLFLNKDLPVSKGGFTMRTLATSHQDVKSKILTEVTALLGKSTDHPKGVSQNDKGEWMLEYSERGAAEVKTTLVKEATLEQLKSLKSCLKTPREATVLADGGAAPASEAEGLADGGGFADRENQRTAEKTSKGRCSIM
ncbi:MAG: ankyrin repeat domain-containing protein [Rickettsiales bacterium]|jgi:ankyrin repeat protein|nr:ankyrin repeat domain-containing protein [Rickettsiales bacterium]